MSALGGSGHSGLLWSIPKFGLELLGAAEPPGVWPLRSSDLPDIASLKVSATSPATSLSPSEVRPRSSAALFKRSPALPAPSVELRNGCLREDRFDELAPGQRAQSLRCSTS